MSRKATNVVTTIGIDICKQSFHPIDLDDRCGSIASVLDIQVPG